MESEKKRTFEVEFLPTPNIDVEHNCNIVFDVEADLGVSWMDPITHYLRNGSLFDDRGEAFESKHMHLSIGSPQTKNSI